MKVTTKLAKNGARLYYVDSKRVSRDKALESAAQNRVGNPFVVECDKEQNHYLIQGGIEKHIYTDRRTFDKLNIRIDNYHGFTVYCGTCQLRTFACNTNAKNFAVQIEDAFINGEHGIKITVDGTISILPAEIDASDYAITTEAQDAAIEAETELAKSGDTDNFDTQVADALKARNVAKTILDEKDAIVAKVKAEMRQACDVYEATKANIRKLYKRKAAELTAKIKVPERFMKVIKQNGTDDFIRKDLFVYAHEIYNRDKHVDEYFFAIGKYDECESKRFATYETPAQVERVIHRLKAAIERGDEEFTFPTVKELKLRYVLDRTADGQYLFNVDGTVSPIRFWYSDAQGNEISREEVRELELEFVHGYDKDDEDFLDEDDRWFNEGDRRYDEMRDM